MITTINFQSVLHSSQLSVDSLQTVFFLVYFFVTQTQTDKQFCPESLSLSSFPISVGFFYNRLLKNVKAKEIA